MSEPAYLSEELDISSADKVAAFNLATTPGSRQPTADELIESLQRNGQDQSILEVALALPLEEYRRVEEVYRRTERRREPQKRRRA